uniref:Uncharacterized protein n=1 Tax=Bombyx mori TaxID=7091 RepID=A0A8R2R0A5_BOMMO|nr:uncharacterized protein LOC119629952 [Bombyx mori]
MDIYSKLFAQLEDLSTTLNLRMAQHEEDLKNAATTDLPHKTIASLSREFAEFKSFVCNALSALKTQIELLTLGLDRHEMMSRRKVLLLHGVNNNKDPSATVLDILKGPMKLSHIISTDIVTCHHLGANKSKPRPVLIRFKCHSHRSEVWKNKVLLKGSGLTLSEFLTKSRHDAFLGARKHFGLKQCWTSEGKIVIQLSDKTRRKIETVAELRLLINQYPVAPAPSDESVEAVKTTKSQVKNTSDKRIRKPPKQ